MNCENITNRNQWLASLDEEKLDGRLKEMRVELGPKAVRALRRLSVVPMPDVQGAFLRGLTGMRG